MNQCDICGKNVKIVTHHKRNVHGIEPGETTGGVVKKVSEKQTCSGCGLVVLGSIGLNLHEANCPLVKKEKVIIMK